LGRQCLAGVRKSPGNIFRRSAAINQFLKIVGMDNAPEDVTLTANRRRFQITRVFCFADAEYFENYSKYGKLFDEIFMRRSSDWWR
jgi:hypothetical protein